MPFTAPKRIDFGAVIRRKAADTVPAPILTRAERCRVAQIREAAAVLGLLPRPGQTLHALLVARFDLVDLIDVLLSKLGPARIAAATLSFNRRSCRVILGWLDAQRVTALSLLSSSFHKDHNPQLFAEFKAELKKRNARLAADRVHAKVVALHFAGGERLALETSANLRCNGNIEQMALTSDAELCRWHTDWIEARITAHEGDG